MDKLTRKNLKTDKFASEVGHSLEYVAEHRKQAIRYGAAAAVVLVLLAGGYYFMQSRATARQEALARALYLKDGVIGPASQPGDPRPAFASKADKDKAVLKAFQDLAGNYSGTNEGAMGHYQLGALAADEGKLDDAAKHFQSAISDGDSSTASVARWALAQVYQAQGKTAEAEKLLRELVASPTLLVSKDQATFSLIRVIANSKPAEAHKLLEEMQKATNPVVARNAMQLVSELPSNVVESPATPAPPAK
ncbi:MAG: tetratricopeptide repeat protein [Bryobacteraceae bacterium]